MRLSCISRKTVAEEHLTFSCLHDGNHGRPRPVSLYSPRARLAKTLDSLAGGLSRYILPPLDAASGAVIHNPFKRHTSFLTVARHCSSGAELAPGVLTHPRKKIAPFRWSPPQPAGTMTMRNRRWLNHYLMRNSPAEF